MTSLFKWKIEQFSIVASRDDPNRVLESEDFTLPNNLKVFFRFNSTNVKENGPRDYSSLFLVTRNLDNNSALLKFRFRVENSRCMPMNQAILGDREHKFEGNVEFGFDAFIHHDRFYHPAHIRSMISDNIVIICCEVTVLKMARKISSKSDSIVLREKLYSFYSQNSKENCLIEVGKQKFNVSKAVLMSYSKVFDRMLMSSLEESKTATIKIKDASPDIVESFLEFLYLGRLEELDEKAEQLFVLADKYEVESLMDDCIESLIRTSTKENIVDRLKLAFMHGNVECRQNLVEYVCNSKSDGNFHHILKTEKWHKFVELNKKLSDDVLDAIFEKMEWTK